MSRKMMNCKVSSRKICGTERVLSIAMQSGKTL